ncbi:GAF domain-containing protein [Bradyrhizobium sp. BR13661]|uniref:GAF domain-containing protein n=2 Tax=Pseudomonadota TaxID=1224 RepID=UPI002475BA31|nr:GAF domain-containing protein [Bradyrhizobium sp. BR13661]
MTRELGEAREQQAATAEILRVISQSPTDVKPVLDAIVLSAARLFRCDLAFFLRCHGPTFSQAALVGSDGSHIPLDPAALRIDPEINFPSRTIVSKKNLHLPDWSAIDLPEHERRIHETYGINSSLFLPLLLRGGECFGLLALASKHPRIFGNSEISLAESFRDQAVIAIENARLFDEVQAKTRDLTEALTHQTGSSNILRVIASSPTDVQPVLQAIVESACELCEATDATVCLRDGDSLVYNAHHGPIPVVLGRHVISRGFAAGRAIVDRAPVHVHDVLSEEGDEFPGAKEWSVAQGVRSLLSVPLMRDEESIGAILLRRREVQPFTDKQITLLQTFADQAVIAIGNVRLFEEVQAKTRDLQESLQFQTASAEVLKVISRSPDTLQPVLDCIAETSCELCGSDGVTIFLLRDEMFHFTAVSGAVPKHLELLRSNPVPSDDPTSVFGQLALKKQTLHYPNVTDARELDQARISLGGPRALLLVPLIQDGDVLGIIVLRQSHERPFTPRQIQAIETFADQAVIAISNVNLFDEVQARTRDLEESLQQQTATAEVLQVISSSMGNAQPVFEQMLEKATRVCGAEFGLMGLFDGEVYRRAAVYNVPPAFDAAVPKEFRPTLDSGLGAALRTAQVFKTYDLSKSEQYLSRSHPAIVAMVEVAGVRTLVIVPMLRDAKPIGAISIYRKEVSPFSDRQIELLKNFANQAVIAIENAHLLNELRQRTTELSQSLDDLRSAQDRLIQTEKLASLGQLTAGIAHEIKNPLNFVNNFSALSVELTDELNDLLKGAKISEDISKEVDELTGLLKDNLGKVVQHGKRADSIVKNMLLHSREGSGEHRAADINALVEESLNLAYHGARAEKPHFNVTLQRHFDPDAGMLEAFPQEITRVLLNLIANGFYAVSKRKADNDGAVFEPVVSATTKGCSDHVEIRIRDNGTGIPPEVKEKMFNPFFTTKPAGEGTGLGLSMSHDIIVKQHGGTIDVVTEPGQFTEFTIILPRTKILSGKFRG